MIELEFVFTDGSSHYMEAKDMSIHDDRLIIKTTDDETVTYFNQNIRFFGIKEREDDEPASSGDTD